MKEMICFEKEESPYNPGKWVIKPIHDNFFLKSTSGNFNIICARVMNLSYAQYLRFCRDICGATIIGKNKKYPMAYFNDNDKLQVLVRHLNARANTILWNREHPDWRSHQVELRNFKEGRDE